MNSLKVPNNSHITTNFHKVDCFLDITSEVCPMTFVKTKLMLERLAPGAIAEVLSLIHILTLPTNREV